MSKFESLCPRISKRSVRRKLPQFQNDSASVFFLENVGIHRDCGDHLSHENRFFKTSRTARKLSTLTSECKLRHFHASTILPSSKNNLTIHRWVGGRFISENFKLSETHAKIVYELQMVLSRLVRLLLSVLAQRLFEITALAVVGPFFDGKRVRASVQ